MTRPLAIDLFCGLGGWTDGLLALGYRVIGYDIEEHVYGDQRYQGELVIQDVLTLHGSQFKDAALIVASPPCQEYSYMAMPWKRAKAKAAAIRADTTGAELERLNRLFNACFRIQKEASIAAGRHIPMVVENVRGAIPWVGRSRWNFGSFHLWGDVPALMPETFKATKAPGVVHGWKHPSDPRHTPGLDFTRLAGKYASEGIQHHPLCSIHTGIQGYRCDYDCARDFPQRPLEGRKNSGGSWFNIGSPGQKVVGNNPDGRLVHQRNGAPHTKHLTNPAEHNGVKLGSKARKAASAMIAKIPEPLSLHIGKVYWPGEAV